MAPSASMLGTHACMHIELHSPHLLHAIRSTLHACMLGMLHVQVLACMDLSWGMSIMLSAGMIMHALDIKPGILMHCTCHAVHDCHVHDR